MRLGEHSGALTQARSSLVPAGFDGYYHCVTRCVRRAWLCGFDPLSGKNFDHRRDWIEHRLADLAEIFAVSIWSYAVMSNHVHAVIEIRAEAARDWPVETVSRKVKSLGQLRRICAQLRSHRNSQRRTGSKPQRCKAR